MCGITGLVNWSDAATLSRMNDVQRHRGPDDSGLFETRTAAGDWVGLGSRRLAILDLSTAGHMPMTTADEQFTIVYNGEVYNFAELREELKSQGVEFHSGTDTEVVLKLYAAEGPDFVRRLNGMFALAIWDRPRDQLFLARDHLGIKPLYYIAREGKLAFASELKSLLQLPDVDRRINFQALDQFLSFLWVPDPLTMFEGIFKLPAGHSAIFKAGKLSIQQYWDLQMPACDHRYSITESEAVEQVRHRFAAVVKSQLRTDVPLGAFLSAGIDSTAIVAAVCQLTGQPVSTYTIAFPPEDARSGLMLDDPAVAARTAASLGCHHHEILVRPDVADLLPKLTWHLDEPIADPAIIMAYLVNREASRELKVMLSGIGGDEIFAGYRKHQAHYLAERYRRIPQPVRRYAIEPAVALLPPSIGRRGSRYIRLLQKMARSGSLPPVDRFIADSTYWNLQQRHELYSAQVRQAVTGFDARYRHLECFDRVAHADFLNQMLYVDTKIFMVSLNLTYNDKMSMANSVEVRVPFLDHEFVQWAATNIDPRFKLRNGTTKYVLRQAIEPSIPKEVLQQKKAGFAGPIDRWLSNELREMTDDLLNETRVRERGLFDPTVVRRFLDEHRSGRRDWSFQIWQLLTLELWMKTFIDQPVAAVGPL